MVELTLAPVEQVFDVDKMYAYVENFAKEHQLQQTLQVLPYAKEKHQGQFRKGKEKVPYIYHPLLVACHALALGFTEDDMISAALLHDVCEDCGVEPDKLPVNENTRKVVRLLTKTKEISYEKYYHDIRENETATILKLLDRCNNISGMAAAFSREKLINYINFTEKWFAPLIAYGKEAYQEYRAQIFLIEYHMNSVIESLKYQIQASNGSPL